MNKLFDLLKNPLTMAKFLNASDLTKKALSERAMAATALEVVDANVTDMEAKLKSLAAAPEMTAHINDLMPFIAAIKDATSVKAA